MPAEGGAAFVDTNVLLYAYDRSAGSRHRRSAQLVGDLGTARRGVLSVQVLQEFYVNATRKNAEPLDHDTAMDRVRALGRWPTHLPRCHDVPAAAGLSQSAQLSFWDAMNRPQRGRHGLHHPLVGGPQRWPGDRRCDRA